MHPDTDLEILMSRYQQGDSAAVALLIQRLSPQLHRFFLAQLVSSRYADDLLQETWLRIHQARHTYRPGEPVLPWLYAIARHIRVDHFRKQHRSDLRELQVEELPELPAPAPSRAASTVPDMQTLLADLPESQREVLCMLKISGMSLEEVARATSSSVGSVKQKAHRAYDKLRERLRLYGEKGHGVEGQ
jgi:RNA polymerase sigma-70 factor (ECF subfamily)